jgi:hypothetical protein
MTRTRPRTHGSLALKLDFGTATTRARAGRAGSRLLQLAATAGPDKYKVLEHRRRQAQIQARRLLELMEGN